MKSKSAQVGLSVVYTVLAFLMYNSQMEDFTVAGIGFMYRYIWAAVIFIVGLCTFLVTADISRLIRIAKYVFLLCIPHILMVVISIPIWIARFESLSIMRRGLFNEIYMSLMILAMAGMVYAIGERAVWCNLIGLILPNLVIMFNAVRASSLSVYMAELRTAIMTFAGVVGPVISEMEVHELTFALGLYVIVLLVNLGASSKRPWVLALLIAASFLFLSGFKRIGIAAVLAASVAGKLLNIALHRGTWGKKLLIWCGCTTVVFALMYVALITSGLLEYMQNVMGIDLMGRDNLLSEIKNYFFFGPQYMGNGTGFALEIVNGARGKALHNDVLSIYIDIGFWGFLAWMAFYLPVKIQYVAKWQGLRGSIMALAFGIYTLVTAMTDNTINYSFVTCTEALLIMAYRSVPIGKGKEERLRE